MSEPSPNPTAPDSPDMNSPDEAQEHALATSAGTHAAPPLEKKSMAVSTLIGLVVVTLLVVNAWNLWGPSTGLRAGEPAPALDLPELGSDNVVGLESYRGQVVLVDFWATWCPPCREQMPTLQRLSEDPEFEAAVISVNTDDPTDDRESFVSGFLDYNGLTLPTLLDDGQARLRYKVRAVPTLVVVDGEGRVVKTSSGLHSEADLRAFAAEAAEP